MHFENKKLEFSEEQKKALKELKIKNEEGVSELNKILKEYEKQVKSLDAESKIFWEIMKSLEKSHSHYPLGHFANYYYNDFKEPIAESFLTEFGEKNPNFCQITDEDKKTIERKLPNYDKYNKIISDAIENVKNLIANSLEGNIFIRRIGGLPEKYLELQEIKKNWWYPKDLSKSEYGIKSFLGYDAHLPLAIPYHRQKMINYDSLFNTATFMENKIKDFISILKSINSYLPFAELMPSEKMLGTVINVEANANNKSTSIGDSNQFEGDAIIGESEKIGK